MGKCKEEHFGFKYCLKCEPKSFFDLSDKEKKKILMKAAKGANKAQKELMDKPIDQGQSIGNNENIRDTQPKCSKCNGKRIVSSGTPGIKDGHVCFHCGGSGVEPVEPTDQKPIWEESFDEKFYHEETIDHNPCEVLLNNKNGKCNCQLKDIKKFIKEVEKAAYERGYNEGMDKVSKDWEEASE